MVQAMRTMESRYAGKCGTCHMKIAEGETIGYDGAAHHMACVEAKAWLAEQAAAALASLPAGAVAAVALQRIVGTGVATANVFVGEDCQIVGGDREALGSRVAHDLEGRVGEGRDAGVVGTAAADYWIYVVAVSE